MKRDAPNTTLGGSYAKLALDSGLQLHSYDERPIKGTWDLLIPFTGVLLKRGAAASPHKISGRLSFSPQRFRLKGDGGNITRIYELGRYFTFLFLLLMQILFLVYIVSRSNKSIRYSKLDNLQQLIGKVQFFRTAFLYKDKKSNLIKLFSVLPTKQDNLAVPVFILFPYRFFFLQHTKFVFI